MSTVNSDLLDPPHLAALTDGSVTVTGKHGPQWKLKRFNMNDNVELNSQELENGPYGLCEIQLGERPALAISYW